MSDDLHTTYVTKSAPDPFSFLAPGTRTDALVQYADVLPTLIEVDEGAVEKFAFDGSSFLKVMTKDEPRHREYAYGIHNKIPEGPAYPIRSVTDGRFHLIRNLTPDEIYIEKLVMGVSGDGRLNNPYWSTWVWDAWNNRKTYDLVRRYTHRPPIELYDMAADPYELENLANSAQYADARLRLQTELDRWTKLQNDPGADVDTPHAYEAAKRGQHLHGASLGAK